MKNGDTKSLLKAAITACLFTNIASADLILPGNITDFFGNGNGMADAGDASGLLFDEARTGGSDSGTGAVFNPSRSLDAVNGSNSNWATGLPTGNAGTVTFTGLGFALRGGTTATQVSLTIKYLGANGSFGGGDDETVGSVSDNLMFTSTSEYVWKFATPLTFDFDGTETENNFRFELSTGGTGNLRFKTRPLAESPSGQGGLTLSVGGSLVTVPEPSSFAFFALAASSVGFAASRKRRIS